MLLWCVGVFSPGGTAAEETTAERIQAQKEQALPDSHRHSIERRRTATERRQALNMHQYEDSNGVITLTNRPEKYRDRNEYTEIRIDFEQIYVPQQYQAYTSPAQ